MADSLMGTPFMNKLDRQNAQRDATLQAKFQSVEELNLPQEQKDDIRYNIAQDAYGPSFNRKDFNFLLDRLTGSKIRQNRDAQAQERQNIYARGLSSMFANF